MTSLRDELALVLAKYHNHSLPNMTFPTFYGDVEVVLSAYDNWVDKTYDMLYDPEDWERWLFLNGVR